MRGQFLQSPRRSEIGRGGRGSSSGGQVTLPTEPPSDGLIADWRFSEGTGTSVADETGTYDISLTAAPVPGTITWTGEGVHLNLAAVQTPVMTGVRTIAMLYKVPAYSPNAYEVSGPATTTDGARSRVMQTDESYWIGQGFGVAPIVHNATGLYGDLMLTGGWRLFIREIDANTNGYLTFGSRGASTSARHADMDLAWAAVYGKVLSDAERDELFRFARGHSVGRGFRICLEDCSIDVDYINLWGQSNANGREAITNLSAPEQSRVYARTFIQNNNINDQDMPEFEALELGVNHCDYAGYPAYGPEIPIAALREDTVGARDLYISKQAVGGTFLAPSSDANVAFGGTFSTDEEPSYESFNSTWRALYGLYRGFVHALENDIRLNNIGMVWFQGEADSDYVSTADVYQDQMNALIGVWDQYLGSSDYPIIVCRTYWSAVSNPTAYATVRAAQAAVVAGLGARGTLIDTDGMTRRDSVHLGVAGLQDLANAVAVEIW